jgi:hypothetical protein
MIKQEVTIKGITYTVRGRTPIDIEIAIKALKKLNRKTKEQDDK